MLELLVEGVLRLMLRLEAFDDERCCLDEAVEDERCCLVGVGWVRLRAASDMGVFEIALPWDALLATEAECCARSADSSRVSRLTWEIWFNHVYSICTLWIWTYDGLLLSFQLQMQFGSRQWARMAQGSRGICRLDDRG